MIRLYAETEVVARVDGLTVARLRAFVAAECVAPEEREGRLAFAEADVARLQLARRSSSRTSTSTRRRRRWCSRSSTKSTACAAQLRALGEAVAAEPEEVRGRVRDRLAGAGPAAVAGACSATPSAAWRRWRSASWSRASWSSSCSRSCPATPPPTCSG